MPSRRGRGGSTSESSSENREAQLLARWVAGEPNAFDDFISHAYPHLRNQAHLLLRLGSETIDSEELVHELYMRLSAMRRVDFPAPRVFYAFAAFEMRRVLINRARARHAQKRGGHQTEITSKSLENLAAPATQVDLDTSLTLKSLLNNIEPELTEVISFRFAFGYTAGETAHLLGLAKSEVQGRWRAAKRRLQEQLSPNLSAVSGVLAEEEDHVTSLGVITPVITLDLVSPDLLLALAAHPELMKTLEWRAFERLLARTLEDLSYEIELQRGTKDGGIDIFAIKRDGPFGPHRYLLQAKRWKRSVGVQPVREILFLQSEHRITKACLATTSRFTRGAWKLAEDYRWLLELRDYQGLQEWIRLALLSQHA